MKKYVLIVCACALIGLGATACGTTSSSPAPADDSALVSQTPEDVIAAHPGIAQQFCDNYGTLVDQGWNNETIYSEMDAAGAFDGYGDSHASFDALVRWCYQH